MKRLFQYFSLVGILVASLYPANGYAFEHGTSVLLEESVSDSLTEEEGLLRNIGQSEFLEAIEYFRMQESDNFTYAVWHGSDDLEPAQVIFRHTPSSESMKLLSQVPAKISVLTGASASESQIDAACRRAAAALASEPQLQVGSASVVYDQAVAVYQIQTASEDLRVQQEISELLQLSFGDVEMKVRIEVTPDAVWTFQSISWSSALPQVVG